MSLHHNFPPNLSLVWVAASMGPSLRSPYGRLSSKNLNAINLPDTCTTITDANLPLRIASTLLKGTVIVLSHQYTLHLSMATNTVQHLRLLLSSSSWDSFSLPAHDLLTRKDALTIPEFPGLLELTLASHISELPLPFAPAAIEMVVVDDQDEPERRRAAAPSPKSFLSTDNSLLPEAAEYYGFTGSSPKLGGFQNHQALDRRFHGSPDLLMNGQDSLMHLDLGLNLPPMDPLLPEYSALSTITPEPVDMLNHFLIPEQRTLDSVGGGHDNMMEDLEPARKRTKYRRQLRVDTHLEISTHSPVEHIIASVKGTFSKTPMSQIASRILGPLIPGLPKDSVIFCTSTNKMLTSSRRPFETTVGGQRLLDMDVELRRAVSMLDNSSTMLAEGSPDPRSWIYSQGIDQLALGSPLERPSGSPMSSFGSFGVHPSFQSLDLPPLHSPTTAPSALANTDLMIHEDEFEDGGDQAAVLKHTERESTQFLQYLNNFMRDRNTNQVSFKDIIDGTDQSKRVAAQAFYHIVALVSLGEIKVRQDRPFDPIHVLEK